MASAIEIVGLLVILGINAAVTALMTRFFRVRLHTRWGSLLFALLLTPLVMLFITLVASGVFGLGPNLGSPGAVVGITILVPLTVGITFDYVWMPSPDEVELPEKMQT
jgi:hypothetical protein